MTRPVTTLKSNQQFKLTSDEQKNGFYALYRGRVGMSPYDFMFKLTTRLIWPWAADENPDIHKDYIKQYIKTQVSDESRRIVIRSTLRRNNAAKRLEFRTPIYHTPAGASNYLQPGVWSFTYKFPTIPDQASKVERRESIHTVEDTVFAGGKVLTADQVIAITKFSGRQAQLLKNTLLAVEAVAEGGMFIIYATWKVSQSEAEFLNNVPMVQINLGQLYPTLIEWSATCLGQDASLPETICPISNVVSGVETAIAKQPIKPRVGLLGAVTDVNRGMYILPKVNAAVSYEQQMLDFGTQEDGSYTWSKASQAAETLKGYDYNVGEEKSSKKLPINMPVYVDWLNDKFVYSNSSGNLAVYDLGKTVPVTNFHITQLLGAEVELDVKKPNPSWAVLCTAVDHAAQFDPSILKIRPTDKEIESGKIREELNSLTFARFDQVMKAAMEAYLRSGGDMAELFIGSAGVPAPRIHQLAELPQFGWVFGMILRAKTVLERNVEAMYTKFSVLNTLGQLTLLTMLAEFAPHHKEVVAADKKDRDVYLTQGVDPSAPIEAVPNIKEGLQYLPHQAKVQNILRRGPAFATIPVDAGGGKTISILTNILLEIKRGHCRKPIIMCPSHLVSQYVKEAVFVTEGRVNIIPVTNASLKVQGEDKLKLFIDKAPLNTVVVTDFNFIKGRAQRVAYGNKTVTVYRNAEFMRQFEFDLVAIDEVHYLKNYRSARRDAAARFMQDIPMKRLASGTMVSDTILDLVSQIALLDPVLFGSEDAFKDEFAAERRGNKVLSWLPGAEAAVKKRIAEHAVVAGARRKEWAALLPPQKSRFRAVELTKNQRLLYDSILKETMDLINEAMAKDAELRDMMDSEDDSKAEELETLLRPYLARLERFMSAPGEDQAAQLFLKDPMDLVSPKVREVYTIVREHLENKIPGKIIVFTQYVASAQAVYDNAPSDLKRFFIHYTADQKIECKTEFENNPEKMVMVGVSSSMDTGLNLQYASRLIRMETVWTPGILEQGNARINRPELKKSENRNMIYFDWLVINRSVDITKVSRLVSKIVSKAKFDEAGNLAYEEIPNLPQVAMTVASIAENNDFREELLPYLEAYQTYQKVEQAEFDAYKEQQGGNIVPVKVPQGGILKDSKLMSRVPYVPEMELYAADKLGLVRYDQFLRQDLSELEGDSDDGDDEEDVDDQALDGQAITDPKLAARFARRQKIKKERVLMKGRAVHTDFGDGTVRTVGGNRVHVTLADGTKLATSKFQVFVITRSTTNSIDMRNELLKEVGKIPLDHPIQVPVEIGPMDKKRKAKNNTDKTEELPAPTGPQAELDFTVLNDFLALMYRGDGGDAATVAALQNFGFRATPHYNYVKILGPKVMLRFMRTLKDKGFKITPQNSSELKRIYDALKSNRQAMSTFGFATQMSITNFYRQQVKPNSDPELLKIYPLVQDGMLFLLFPIKGQPANQKAKRVQVSNASWKTAQDLELVLLLRNKLEAKEKLKEILSSGITIPPKNLKELEHQFKTIKLVSHPHH